MGLFEVFHFWWIVNVLATVIISILSLFSYKNLLSRFGVLKRTRKDYYECGFRSFKQKPITISFQFFIICLFFIIYDIELIFSFPLIAALTYYSIIDIVMFSCIYFTMVLSLIYDFNNKLMEWRY